MKKFMNLVPLMNMDGGGGGFDAGAATEVATTDYAPSTPTPEATPAAPVQTWGMPQAQPPAMNPLLDPNFAPNPTPTPQTEQLDFAGRMVNVVDPVIKDIHKDYTQLQKTFQETNNGFRQMQEQNQFLMGLVQQFQQQPQAPVAPQQPPGPTPEQLQEFNQQYTERFYDNPVEANKMLLESPFMKDVLQKQVEQMVRPFIEPFQKERQFNQEVQSAQNKYPDFQQFAPQMQAALQANPKLADLGLETVYLVAKGAQSNAAPQQMPTPQQLLSDPNFKQHVFGNEQIRNEIIQQYMTNRTQSNQQIPPVMGNQPGGNPPAMPEQRPKSIREASNAFSKFLGL